MTLESSRHVRISGFRVLPQGGSPVPICPWQCSQGGPFLSRSVVARGLLTCGGTWAVLLSIHSPFPSGPWVSSPSSGKDPSALRTPSPNSLVAGPPLTFAEPGAREKLGACSLPLLFCTLVPSCTGRGLTCMNVDAQTECPSSVRHHAPP